MYFQQNTKGPRGTPSAEVFSARGVTEGTQESTSLVYLATTETCSRPGLITATKQLPVISAMTGQ